MKLRILSAHTASELNSLIDEFVNNDLIEILDFKFSASSSINKYCDYNNIYAVCISYKIKK